MRQLRILFMGTPDFAVGILDTILSHSYQIVGIITAPDKPAGRGQKTNESAVKKYAQQNQLPLLQPPNLKDPIFLEELRALNANLFIVVAFRMLPKQVWQMPEYGTFNLHASLLPQYRGAAPINWAIINGEAKTGVSTFFIDDKIDTGAVILQTETDILPNENVGDLHDRLMLLGSETVIQTLKQIENDSVTTLQQTDSENLKTAYKLDKTNCKIDWNQSNETIHNLIRGLNPYPSAWCFFKINEDTFNVKIYESESILETHSHPIGVILTTKNELKITTNQGYISILSLQFPGKKRMNVKDFLNGIQIPEDSLAF